LITINSVAGYSTLFPISLTGTEVSTAPFLSVAPITVDFGGVVVTNPGNLTNIQPESDVVTIANKGLGVMIILGYAYALDYANNNPTWINATSVNGVWDLGYGK
jgi:iron transport multicopper oxidase